jgi:hypothetical protein
MEIHGEASEMSKGQLKELIGVVARCTPDDLPPDDAQYWIGHPVELHETLARALRRSPAHFIRDWQEFYQKIFGMAVDLSGIRIPAPKPGFKRIIFVAQGLTLNQVFQACKERFPCWRFYSDPDQVIIHNDRSPANSSYAIRVRNRIEADEELRNLSAKALANMCIVGITLLERLLFELKYFEETGKHLDHLDIKDTKSYTLCSGSSGSDGGVPVAGWLGGRLDVDRKSPWYADDGLRAREVVS